MCYVFRFLESHTCDWLLKLLKSYLYILPELFFIMWHNLSSTFSRGVVFRSFCAPFVTKLIPAFSLDALLSSFCVPFCDQADPNYFTWWSVQKFQCPLCDKSISPHFHMMLCSGVSMSPVWQGLSSGRYAQATRAKLPRREEDVQVPRLQQKLQGTH